jgi:prolipoprotein diacylglyceryltransferase
MRRWTSYHYGQLFSVWVIWYGVQRFLIDSTRLDAARNGTVADSVMGPFTGSQWGALGAAALGLALFLWFRNRSAVVSTDDDVGYGAELPDEEEALSSR